MMGILYQKNNQNRNQHNLKKMMPLEQVFQLDSAY